MKTSNKLIIFGIAVVVLAFTAVLFYLSSKVVVSDEVGRIGKNVVGEKVLSEKFDSDTLYIYNDFEYYLDPNSEQISVQSDEEILDLLHIKNYRGTYPYREKTDYVSYAIPIKFTFGVKGKNNLTIISKGAPLVKTLETITIENINIEAQDRSNLVLDVKCNSINISTEYKAYVDLGGELNNGDFVGLGNSTVDLNKIEMDSMRLTLSDDALLRVKHVKAVTGELEDNARFRTLDKIDVSNITFFDKAKHTQESWD